MLGDGMVSFGVMPDSATEARNEKSSPKIVSVSRTGACTRSAAEVNSRSPSALWNWTLIRSSDWPMPPSR
jgi:hypothetical protein